MVRQEGAYHAVELGSCSLLQHSIAVHCGWRSLAAWSASYTMIPELHACSWAQEPLQLWQLDAVCPGSVRPNHSFLVAWMHLDSDENLRDQAAESDKDTVVGWVLFLWQTSCNTWPFADDPSSPPLPGRKATENEDEDDLSIMSEELEEDPETEPAHGEGDDDDEDGPRWACHNDAASRSAVHPERDPEAGQRGDDQRRHSGF